MSDMLWMTKEFVSGNEKVKIETLAASIQISNLR